MRDYKMLSKIFYFFLLLNYQNVFFIIYFLLQNAADELKDIFPQDLYKAIPELVYYLLESFGNPTRIDYGTGHEMAFIMFLCCMFKIGAFEMNDKTAVGTKVFNR